MLTTGWPMCCGEKMDRNDSERYGYENDYQCRECGAIQSEVTRWYLEYPEGSGWRRVLNSECRTQRGARTLLADRAANDESFYGERVAAETFFRAER